MLVISQKMTLKDASCHWVSFPIIIKCMDSALYKIISLTESSFGYDLYLHIQVEYKKLRTKKNFEFGYFSFSIFE